MKALLAKTGLSKSRIYAIIKAKQRALRFTVTLEQAAILVSGEMGVDISKIASPEELQSVTRFVTASSFPVPETVRHDSANVPSTEKSQTVTIGSKAIERVLSKARKLQIENIDQNWVDALVVLNFMETAASKFLTEHGYSESGLKQMYWDEKINRVKDKLYEEAKRRESKPRTSVLTVIKNYREQRNEIDHQAHFPGAQIQKYEVDLLLKTLDAFTKQVFEEHRKDCPLGRS
jgi:hypothetical protein